MDEEKCIYCDGAGLIRVDGGVDIVKCEKCNGTGKVECESNQMNFTLPDLSDIPAELVTLANALSKVKISLNDGYCDWFHVDGDGGEDSIGFRLDDWIGIADFTYDDRYFIFRDDKWTELESD